MRFKLILAFLDDDQRIGERQLAGSDVAPRKIELLERREILRQRHVRALAGGL